MNLDIRHFKEIFPIILVDYKWKKKNSWNLFEQIFQINQLSINEYFDFESLEAQTNKRNNIRRYQS